MRKSLFLVVGVLLFSGCIMWRGEGENDLSRTTVDFASQARRVAFDVKKAPESSGIVESVSEPGLFFTHGDSFSPSALFAFRADGEEADGYRRFPVRGASQFDWEDLSSDGNGKLYLANIGDNWRFRSRKTIYVIDEAQMLRDGFARVERRIVFRCRYKGCTVFADTEALFYHDRLLYVITKNRGTALLFRIDLAQAAAVVDAEFVEMLHLPSRVTAAEVSRDGSLLAVLSLKYLFLYDLSGGVADLYSKEARVFRMNCRQCEAVCFTSDGRIAVTNEQGELFLYPYSAAGTGM